MLQPNLKTGSWFKAVPQSHRPVSEFQLVVKVVQRPVLHQEPVACFFGHFQGPVIVGFG